MNENNNYLNIQNNKGNNTDYIGSKTRNSIFFSNFEKINLNQPKQINNKKKIKFKTINFVEIIQVESYKQYNCDISEIGYSDDNIKAQNCECRLF